MNKCLGSKCKKFPKPDKSIHSCKYYNGLGVAKKLSFPTLFLPVLCKKNWFLRFFYYKIALLIIMSVMICSAGVGAIDPVKYKPKTVPYIGIKFEHTLMMFLTIALSGLLVGSEVVPRGN
jgi:hypothetical protein